MEKMYFDVLIDAPKEKVWEILWGEETYPKWTSAFSDTSIVQTDWQQGSKVLFLDGSGQGMVSVIAEKRPNEYMSFKHLGIVKDGVEDTESEEVKKWAGAHENYTLQDAAGKTKLLIDMDIDDQHKDMFSGMWPKALQNIKSIAEEN